MQIEMLIFHCDNSVDRGQELRTRRPSYTCNLDSLYMPDRIPEFYRNDGIHELIGLPHEDFSLEANLSSLPDCKTIALGGYKAFIIDHEALHPEFSGFWENNSLGAAISKAILNGAVLWIGFQSSGYIPAWMKKILPAGKSWKVRFRGEADSIVLSAKKRVSHPLMAGFNADEPTNWFCGDTWRALRCLASTEPFDLRPQKSEYGSISWLALPEEGWQIIAARNVHPDCTALAEASAGKGKIVLDQTLALHGANIDSINARRFADSMRRYLCNLSTDTPVKFWDFLGGGFIALKSEFMPEHAPAQIKEYHGIPFKCYGDENMLCYREGTAKLHIGCEAERLFLLGGTLSFPGATGSWFIDALDFSQDFFIGDYGGQIRILYKDGREDTVPLIFGSTFFWQERFFRNNVGWQAPFDRSVSRKLLSDALKLSRAEGSGSKAWILDISPRLTPIDCIIVEQPFGKTGVPVFASATAMLPGWGKKVKCSGKTIVAGTDIKSETEKNVALLQKTLYTFKKDYDTAEISSPPNSQWADIRFYGGRQADALSCIYSHNMADIKRRIHPVHGTVNLDSGPRFGRYREGNGTFTDISLPGKWEPNGWSRDNGRAGIERVSLGLHKGCSMEIELFDKHLYCGSPPHMERTLSDMRQTHLWQRKSLKGKLIRVAPENDGHGLIMLYRAAYMRHYPGDIDKFWKAGVDYAEWICFAAENPLENNQPLDTLYTVSECSGFGGWEIHSHALCRAALSAMVHLAVLKGEKKLAERWSEFSDRLSRSMFKSLTTGTPERWYSSPISNWQSGAEALTPLLAMPDWFSYDHSMARKEEQAINRQTFDGLTSCGKWWLRQRMIGYDLALVTQAAILLDDPKSGKLIDTLCRAVYSAKGPGPWIVAEGSVFHQDEKMWYRCGTGGNLVHLAETLKVVRLLAGVDDLTPGVLKLMPRLPDSFTGIDVKKYPVSALCVSGREDATLDYKLRRSGTKTRMEIKTSRPVQIMVRLGAFMGEPLPGKVLINGYPAKNLSKTADKKNVWVDAGKNVKKLLVETF